MGEGVGLMLGKTFRNTSVCLSEGFVVWDAARYLSQILCEHPTLLQGASVLEIGAGVQKSKTERGDGKLAGLPMRLRSTASLGLPSQVFAVAQLDWHIDPPWVPGHFDFILGASSVTTLVHQHMFSMQRQFVTTSRKLKASKPLADKIFPLLQGSAFELQNHSMLHSALVAFMLLA
eukprot:239539-Amphidinium_carterae.3